VYESDHILYNHDQISRAGGITQGCQRGCVSFFTKLLFLPALLLTIGGRIKNDEIAVSTLYRIDCINSDSLSVRLMLLALASFSFNFFNF
jgi:hypothetical protein